MAALSTKQGSFAPPSSGRIDTIHIKYLIKASHHIEIKRKIEQHQEPKNITQVIYIRSFQPRQSSSSAHARAFIT